MGRIELSNLRWSVFSAPGEVKQEGGGVFREGTPYQRRGSLQLWQFLVALLDDPGNAHFIAWTGRGMEFKLIEPEEVNASCALTGSLCVQTEEKPVAVRNRPVLKARNVVC